MVVTVYGMSLILTNLVKSAKRAAMTKFFVKIYRIDQIMNFMSTFYPEDLVNTRLLLPRNYRKWCQGTWKFFLRVYGSRISYTYMVHGPVPRYTVYDIRYIPFSFICAIFSHVGFEPTRGFLGGCCTLLIG